MADYACSHERWFNEGPEPAAPAAGLVAVWAAADGTLHAKNAAGVDTTLAPAGWCRFGPVAGTGAITADASHNVASLTDGGTGVFTVTWDTDFSSGNYGAVATASHGSHLNVVFNALAAGSASIRCFNDATAATDPLKLQVVAFGDQ